jgi:hypothetical protein
MKRMKAVFLLFALMLITCYVKQIDAQRKQPIPFSPEEQGKNVAELKPGEASGTIKGGGETVRVQYAYARWVKDEFNANEKMIELLLTEKAIPKEKLAFVFADTLSKVRPSYAWLGGALRGIRFQLKKDGYTYHTSPTHLDKSFGGGNGLDEFKLEGDLVSGADEDRDHGIDDDRWGYSISFVATVSK